MIYREKIISALESKKRDFFEFDHAFQDESAIYHQALDKLAQVTGYDLLQKLNSEETPSPGALPTREFDNARSLVIPFHQQWNNHKEARDWAYKTLLNKTTFAVDGSQIMPTKNLSVPVAAVQIGWFENPHKPEGHYVKDAHFEILTPKDLTVGTGAERQVSDQQVNFRRFDLEVNKLCEYMKSKAQGANSNELKSSELPPVLFFDSSIVISFAERMHEEPRAHYVNRILQLLKTSEETQVPVIGYIDTSYARDITNMLQFFFNLPHSEKIHDAHLLQERMRWGDRTPFFICAREGVLDYFGDFRRRVGFVYLKTNSNLPPTRLDLPLWIYERGLLDEISDVVRAEVIVGNGYPYAIETADAATVITMQDRESFYRIFQEFAEKQKMKLRISRKAISKERRR